MASTPDHSSRIAPPIPFSLEIEVLDAMVNFEIADHPVYDGFEVQSFDDPRHGRGSVVLLSRRPDGRVDVYRQPGLSLDPEKYRIGGGLGAWVEADFEVARVDVSPTGVDAEVRFADVDGRLIDVRVGDRTRRRRMAALLAPLGAAVADPRSLLLVWMSQFDLLRRSGAAPRILIDGRAAAPGRLPAERLTRRRLIKAASDLVIVAVNPAADGRGALTAEGTGGRVDATADGIRSITASEAAHRAVLRFDPPFPDLAAMAVGRSRSGAWGVAIDGHDLVGGRWTATRHGDDVRIGLDVTDGWHPQGLPLLMKIVTRVAKVFRSWPTTYRWTATVILGDPPRTVSRWERTGTERGGSYRSLTGSD